MPQAADSASLVAKLRNMEDLAFEAYGEIGRAHV